MSITVVYETDSDLRLEKMRGLVMRTSKSRGYWPNCHCHTGIEVTLVHSGSVEILTDQWQCLAGPGTAVVLTTSHPHRTRPVNGLYVRTHLLVSYELVDDHPLMARIWHKGCATALPQSALERCIWAIRQLETNPGAARLSLQSVKGLVNLILWEVTGALEECRDEADTPLDLVAGVLFFMNHHLGSKETLSELARRFNVSERHLFRVFRKAVGISPAKYWTQKRMQAARELLAISLPIKTVAQEVGYDSITAFERAYQRQFGTRPAANAYEN
ncbi:MAG TPA: helix-turn-helix transcriptional regulator [Firmicutes bacterium]|nr:helix-turn-helix transcriptional regulator [Bacillota bacterium]